MAKLSALSDETSDFIRGNRLSAISDETADFIRGSRLSAISDELCDFTQTPAPTLSPALVRDVPSAAAMKRGLYDAGFPLATTATFSIAASSYTAPFLSARGLFTVPAGRSLMLFAVSLRATSVAGLTADPVVNVTSEAGDVVFQQTVSGMAANRVWNFDVVGNAPVLPAGTALVLGIPTPALATTFDVVAYVYGVLL